jgi:hypothetical protein
MTLLDDIARQLKLTPDSEMFREDQEIRALKFFTTAGSYIMFPTYADILTLHQDLADREEEAGGIVFVQDKRHNPLNDTLSM